MVDQVPPPSDYDLSRLMTSDFKDKNLWGDLANVASRMLYDLVAKNRKAMTISMEPEVLKRELKIAHAKMESLDHRSSSFTNDDYDRALKFIHQYHPASGTPDFDRFMGFLKNTNLVAFPLWTQDYVVFTLGLPADGTAVYDEPAGTWYPTTQVGLAHDPGIDLDHDELTRLFYRLAPITIVLRWIGTIQNIILPPWNMATAMYSTDWSYGKYIEVFDDFFWLTPLMVAFSQSVGLYDGNQSEVEIVSGITGFEMSWDSIPTYPKFQWDSSMVELPSDWHFTRSTEGAQFTSQGKIVWLGPDVPRIANVDPETMLSGWNFEPTRYNLLRHSVNFSMPIWAKTTSIAVSHDGATAPDGSVSWRVADTSTTTVQYIRQEATLGLTSEVWTGSMIVKAGTSTVAALYMGVIDDTGTYREVRLVVNLNTGHNQLVGYSGMVAEYGTMSLWNGWYWCWMSVNRGKNYTANLRIYPAWNTTYSSISSGIAAGYINTYYACIENGTYPTSPIRTYATPNVRGAELLRIDGLPQRLNGAQGVLQFKYVPTRLVDKQQVILEALGPAGDLQSRVSATGKIEEWIKFDVSEVTHTSSMTKISRNLVKPSVAWTDIRFRSFDGDTAIGDNFYQKPIFTDAVIGNSLDGKSPIHGHLTSMWFIDYEVSPSDLEILLGQLGPGGTPSLDFSDPNNSQYIPVLLI